MVSKMQEVGVKGAALLAGQWLGWHSSFTPDGKYHTHFRDLGTFYIV